MPNSFWKSRTIEELKVMENSKVYSQRLSYDIQKLIPHLRYSKHVCEFSCGLGRHIKILDQIYSFNEVFVTDINEMAVFNVLMDTPLNFSGYHFDLTKQIPSDVDKADTILWLNSVQYITDDPTLGTIFSELRGKKLVAIVQCSPDYSDRDEHSDVYGKDYKVRYRPYGWINKKLNQFYDSVKSERIYPNSLENSMGYQHWLFSVY